MIAFRLYVLDLLSMTGAAFCCSDLVLLAHLQLFIACFDVLGAWRLLAADVCAVAVFPGLS